MAHLNIESKSETIYVIMKGIKLAQTYFESFGSNMIREKFSKYEKYIAAGLVGEGSECLGYDDEYSRDHDFGPGFCLWLPSDIFKEIGSPMQNEYNRLPKEFMGYERIETYRGGGRVGVFSIDGFYGKFLGLSGVPAGNMEWLRIPESYLATATNGEIFIDNHGEFSKIREKLLGFYPMDVLRKKLAARSAVMAQSGQYNYSRCAKRGEYHAAYMACSVFAKAALSAMYMLNRQYIPFYKWSFKGIEKFGTLQKAAENLKRLVEIPDTAETCSLKEELIESICVQIEKEFRAQGLTSTQESFLQAHGDELMEGIKDPILANMHIMADASQ